MGLFSSFAFAMQYHPMDTIQQDYVHVVKDKDWFRLLNDW